MRLLNINHMYNLLLTSVDMQVENINIISSTTRGPIYFNERALKYNPYGFTLVHKGEILFDPLNNFKQAQTLFSIFLQMQENEEGIYTQIFYDEKLKSEEKTRICIKTNIGNFNSKFYYNISLGYIELILIMSGIIVENLHEFDTLPITDEKTRRRPLFPIRDLFN